MLRDFLAAAVFAVVGFCYLHLRYRNRLKVKRALVKKYEDRYSNAGQDFILKLVAAVGIVLVLGLMGMPFLVSLNR